MADQTAPQESLTLRLLEIEFEKLQSAIDKFDEQRFKIKGWSITVAGALLALGVNGGNTWLIVAGAVAALFFFYMETIYMQIQVRIIKRNNVIESLLELAREKRLDEVQDGYRFGMSEAFVGEFQWSAIPDTLQGRPHITAFHLGLVPESCHLGDRLLTSRL
jgi:hypothetical protein